MANAKQTRAETQNTDPSTTTPGDGPADTTDPSEIVSTVGPGMPSDEAVKVGTVNAAVKVGEVPEDEAPSKGGRVETYKATRPDGTEVTVTHNVDTGESSVK